MAISFMLILRLGAYFCMLSERCPIQWQGGLLHGYISLRGSSYSTYQRCYIARSSGRFEVLHDSKCHTFGGSKSMLVIINLFIS